MKKNRLQAMSSTAKSIKCKYTGLKLIEADSKRDNSRAFYKLPNGEYLSKSTSVMKKYLDDLFPEQVENEGINKDKVTGGEQIKERYRETIEKLKR